MAGSHGHFELNVFKPLIIHNILQSIEIMSDSSKTFAMYCVKGIKADKKRITYLLENSLMLVTALAPKIGYDKAAFIAKKGSKIEKSIDATHEHDGPASCRLQLRISARSARVCSTSGLIGLHWLPLQLPPQRFPPVMPSLLVTSCAGAACANCLCMA